MKIALILIVASFITNSLTTYNLELKGRAINDYEGSNNDERQQLIDDRDNAIILRSDIAFYTGLVYLVSLLMFMFSSISVATDEALNPHVRLGLLFISGTGLIFLGIKGVTVIIF